MNYSKIQSNKIEALALIHPERTIENSPYQYLAGVGVAFILAYSISKKFNSIILKIYQ